MKRLRIPALPYQKFVILSHLRSGTHLLRSALESHPSAVCQSEVFNSDDPRLPYPLSTATDEVLRRWVYKAFPPQIEAAGFVMQVYHPRGLAAFPGIRENAGWADIWSRLEAMADLKVIHLRRENGLRRHLSHVMARETGEWHAWDRSLVDQVTHLEPPRVQDNVSRAGLAPVTLERERLALDFEETERLHARAAEIFQRHDYMALRYEDLVNDFAAVSERLLAFLDLPPRTLTAAVGKLDQRPLNEAIANYSALRRDFAGTRWAAFFED